MLAAASSPEVTALFGELLPAFEREHPKYRLMVNPVSNEHALSLGERGEADVLILRAPEAERLFITAGHGTARAPVMHRDYVIVGPARDPAGVRAASSPAEAFAGIARAKAPFVSRGDQSGTHARELELWQAAGLAPRASSDRWYQEAGLGMAETLSFAGMMDAYALSDRATYEAARSRLRLALLLDNQSLRNQYSVIVVAKGKNAGAARKFASWLTARAAQQLIAEFGRAQYGQPLFTPSSQ